VNVVIIEDEGIMGLFLEENLKELNYNVLATFSEANSFYNFLNQNNNNIDIVLMDILISGAIDGIEAGRYLKTRYPHILLIFISSYKDSETINLASEVNPHAYLVKPINKHDLEASLSVVKKFKKDIPKKKIEENIIEISSYKYNKKEKSIYIDDLAVKLSLKEKICLELLITNKNNIVPIEALITQVWMGEDNNGINSLRELIYRLRKKLPNLNIKSSQGLGYILKN